MPNMVALDISRRSLSETVSLGVGTLFVTEYNIRTLKVGPGGVL